MTDAAPPLPTADAYEPPRGRAALLTAALRGGVAALGALWVGTTARWLQVQPGELFAPGLAALAIAPLLLVCLWRLRMSRAEVAAVLGFLVVVPLLGLTLLDSPTIAFAVLVGVAVGAALVGALDSLERATLERASTLRARAASALLCGVGAFVGCGVVVLQAGFTWGVISANSLQGGYALVDRLVMSAETGELIVSGLIAGLVTIVTFARMSHSRLGRQLLLAACLTLLVVPVPVMLIPGGLVAAFVAWSVLPVIVLVVALRGLDSFEASLSGAPRPGPLDLPAGTRRRVLVTAVAAVVAVSLLHAGLTLVAANRRARVLEDLTRRGEPLRIFDLGEVPEDEDAFVLHRRAAAAAVSSMRLTARSTGEEIAVLTSFQAANAPALALLSEGARRPRCRIVWSDKFEVGWAAHRLLESLLKLRVLQGDVDGAVELLRLRRALFAGAEPALAWSETVRASDAAQRWTLELLARCELSAESCRALLALTESPPGAEALRGALQELRLFLLESRESALDDRAPLASRLEWVRDLDLVDALARADLAAAALQGGGLAALDALSLEQDEWPLWPTLRDVPHVWVRNVVSRANELEQRRRLCVVALSLRLHRLAIGTYPATLDALVPGQLAEVPRDLAGAPFVYALDGTGVTLATVGPPRLVVRVR